jgi:hypothetical protein
VEEHGCVRVWRINSACRKNLYQQLRSIADEGAFLVVGEEGGGLQPRPQEVPVGVAVGAEGVEAVEIGLQHEAASVGRPEPARQARGGVSLVVLLHGFLNRRITISPTSLIEVNCAVVKFYLSFGENRKCSNSLNSTLCKSLV